MILDHRRPLPAGIPKQDFSRVGPDHVLLAICWGRTSREMAQSTLHQFARLANLDAAQDTRSFIRVDPCRSVPGRLVRSAGGALFRGTFAALAEKVKAAVT